MDKKNTFSVATVGIDEKKSEMKVIKSVLSISKNRDPSFQIQDRTTSKELPNVVIVNADDISAVERWHAYHLMNEAKANISALMIGTEQPEDCKYFLGRPLIANRLLVLLERIVTEEQEYMPASVFEDGEKQVEDNNADIESIEIEASSDIRVLVVDDSLPIRTQLKLALSDITKNVDFAEDGEQAIALLDENQYNVVFLDVVLPDVDGYKICKSIKRDPAKRKTPVVMLTSNSSPADRVKGKAAGCDTYIIKPVRREVFEEVVREFIGSP
jgi:CheY-like chemotaxis protein